MLEAEEVLPIVAVPGVLEVLEGAEQEPPHLVMEQQALPIRVVGAVEAVIAPEAAVQAALVLSSFDIPTHMPPQRPLLVLQRSQSAGAIAFTSGLAPAQSRSKSWRTLLN